MGYSMLPVSAILIVFALAFAAIAWGRLLYICFSDGPLAGFLALFLPPVALFLLLPNWREEKELYQLLGAAIICLILGLAL